MEPLIQQRDEEDESSTRLAHQALSFSLHTFIGLGAWVLLMLAGYALNPPSAPQTLILGLSLAVPSMVGFAVTRYKQDEMATLVWMVGLIWILVVCLWVLDLPTGPNECFQCDATDKLMRTFFSIPSPSGLIDNDGPFLATWPAAALVGYSLGARLALRKRLDADD